MNQRLLLLFLLFVVLFLSACASSKSVVSVEEKSKEFAADSLKAKFTLSLKNEKGEMQELSGVLFAVKGIRYRLELSGTFGVGVASLLWTKDGWRMTFPTEKLYLEGQGDVIGDPSVAMLPAVNIHQLAGIFYGDLLPLINQELNKKDSLEFEKVLAEDESKRPFQFLRKRDSREIVSWTKFGRGGAFETIVYESPKEFEKVIVPSKIRYYRNEEPFLELSLKKVQRQATWGSGVWRLERPKNFNPWKP